MSELDELKAALAATNQRLTELEESQSNHIGLDWGASGQNYPHPNQQIAVAEFGGGIMRLDSTGIQIIAPSLANAIWFLNAFSIGPGSAEPHGVIQGLVGSAADDSIVFSFTAENSENNGGLSIDLGTGTAEVRIDTYPFKLASLTADPSTTLVDAMEWYRSDTDKFRGRANGATDNFAMEAWVTAADAAHTGDADDAHDASAISILDTANDFTATDVEGALAELQADNEAHIAAADPHTGYVKENDANYVDLTDGGATTLHSHAGGGGINTLRTTSNQTINGGAGVFVDITGLTFPVVSGTDYAFDFYITFRSAATTTGWKAGVNCPAGTLDFWAGSDVIANGAAGG